MSKLTDDELRTIIDHQFTATLAEDGDLEAQRTAALDSYYGRPLGNEIDGRAQIVSKDMMDTVEWIMPSLLRIFTRDAVQFDPVGPEDEDLARQETGYVTHVLWKKNPGFMILHNWMKDALMQKVGYVKYWWEEEQKACFDEYTGLTDDQLAMTLTDLEAQGDVTVEGHEAREEGGATYHDIKLKIIKKYGCAKVESVPPDEIKVSSDCRGSVKKAKFVAHLRRMTRSDLLEMGYKRARIEDLTEYSWGPSNESIARDSVSENVAINREDESDWATKELQMLECHILVDADDDGIAERRHVLLGGNDILENEEEPEVPLESWSPIVIPHRHSGLSIYDLIEDLTRSKTALQRGLLDNTYFSNNRRIIYDKNTIDVSMLQINRPGGHIANDGPVGNSAMPVPVEGIAGQLLPVIDYIDSVKETRTGVGRLSVGIDADVLAQSTKGAYMDAKSAANQRLEAIARIFAETGLASLYGSLHRLLSRHQDWPTRLKLRNDWVTINPTEWQERANMTVSVGLGNASHEEIRANLGLMAQAQEKAGQVPGLIQPQNVFALFRRIQTELGFEQDNFITDPQSPEYAKFLEANKGQKDPYLEGEEIKSRSQLQGKIIDAGVKREQMAQDRDLTITELEVKSGVDLAKAGIGAEVAYSRAAGAQGNGGQKPTGEPAPAGGV